ncbi:dihydropteroate synthase [Tahibacter aquaticus]|uniref:Dihydropteroate synthase n=1 Tax=Tahibacter aquaticus TaxID=520092 RepID=A0A4R6YP08_9GAMM|nr:dihydropteroate synthase [Tahibacter aquaticus]TDR39440.1 dihydropteroate synthase [Tahibacter aquaticus]
MIHPTLDCAGRELVLDRPLVCGIVNVTPDSFSDGGDHFDAAAAIAHGLQLVEQGADLLDIGGESTRPGAAAVGEDEERRRVIPVIEALARQTHVPISIDTSKPGVMRAAVAAGAGLINDVHALRLDGALDAAADLQVPVCLMHMQGEPRSMQAEPHYDEVVADIKRFLADRIFSCELAGIPRKRLLVDPGFGFGKTLEHNLALLRELQQFANLGAPLLVGLSRKSFLGALSGRQAPAERVYASVAAALIAAQRGAAILRVHDVAATVDALKIWLPVAQPAAVRKSAAPSLRWGDDD